MVSKLLQMTDLGRPALGEVEQRAKDAVGWVFGLLVARQLVTFLTTMVTSRLISPEDFGVASMAATYVAFMVLLDTGMTWATVQANNITRDEVHGLFWLGAATGLVWVLISALLAPHIAVFFKSPQLAGLGVAMGITIFINSLTTQPSAVLRRALKQKTNNTIDAVALVVSSVAAMALAWWLKNYWAIILQAIIFQLLRFCFLAFSSGFGWPAFAFQRSAARFVRKGLGFAASNYVTYVQLYLPTIYVGAIFGSEALGFYSKATALKALPTMYAAMAVTDVMVASMAGLQSDTEKMGDLYRRALRVIAFFGCPLGAMLFPLAPEVVRILYGSQWEESVPLVQILAFSAVALPISTSTIWLFLASGSARAQLKLNILLSILAAAAFAAGYVSGLGFHEIVLLDTVLAAVVYCAFGLVFSHRAAKLAVSETLKIVAPILAVSVVSALIVEFALAGVIDRWQWSFVAKVLAGALLYLVLSLVFLKSFPFRPWVMRALGQ